ncbi:PAS domain-containing sensor histidine kinase [Limisalsivibrio acetivorans]|uniref:PAS domain-containing sensor histidine kinase n=1 Tax=Limisalsivibrio acetivorans TaxID=1304888 RepID=UPI0003B682BC|nr:PAS domain-containing sensor histidine kinase [Limisalsivibrio acetivorans]
MNECLPALMDKLEEGVIVYRERIVYANRAACEISGYTADELALKPVIDLVSSEHKDIAAEAFERRLKGDSFTENYDCLRITTSRGEFRIVKAYSCPIEYKGKPAGMVSFRDITKEVEREKELEDTRDLFEILTNNSYSAIYIYTDTYIFANPEYLEITGYTLEELKKLAPYDLIHESQRDEVRINVRKRLNGERFSQKYHERHLIRKDGKERIVRVATNTIKYKGEYAGLGSAIDITDLVELQNHLEERVHEESRKRLKQEQLMIQQSKLAELGEMLGSISHQWKQPLNALGMMIQDLQVTGEESSELDRDYLDWICTNSLEQISYMNDTITDFNNFLRPSKTPSSFSMEDALWPTIKIFQPQARKSNIKLNIRCTVGNHDENIESKDHGLDYLLNASDLEIDCSKCISRNLRLFGYRNEFMQVLLNIFNNAREAVSERFRNSPGSGEILVNISINEDFAHMEIADNGGGIPEDKLDKVFDPFYTTKENGTGFGLYMVKSIVENNMGGSLEVSNRGKGAVFSLSVPLANHVVAST